MEEIFTPVALDRLGYLADVVWARDDPMPTDRFLAEVSSANAVVFGEWRHDRAGLDAGTSLQALLEVAGGHAHPGLDYDECLRRELLLGSCAPAFGDVVAEMALTLALTALRGVVRADGDMRVGRERWLHEGNRNNTSLFGATIGLVGCGGIASSLQRLLRPFDVDVLGYDPPIPDRILGERDITPTPLEEMFEQAEVLFVLAAPTPENRGLVSASLMERLQPAQALVIVSRAHLVDFEALTCLVADSRFKVGIDVYPNEPLPSDHPIRSAEAAICVPHLAGALPSALTMIGDMVVDDLEQIFNSRQPTRMQYLQTENAVGLRQV